MDQYRFLYGLGVIIRAVVGILCGVVPLIYGFAKGQKTRALTGLFTCIIAGFFCGIFLAPLVSLMYVWRIYKSPEGEAEDGEEESGIMGLNLNSKRGEKEASKEV
jgi:cytosine/uracil/thiamine/allantoin permease